jgi:hypothetical protein
MIDPVILDTAYRNLARVAGLPDDEFWRAYAKIEDAALLCTEPEDHGAIMQALNASLSELGKVALAPDDTAPLEHLQPTPGLA